MATINEFITHARRYLGTKFLHQGRSIYGVDCLGLLICIAEDMELTARDGTLLSLHDQTHYRKNPDGHALRTALDTTLHPVAPIRIAVGHIALFTLDNNPQHLGIITPYPQGGLGLLHAYAPSRRVVEHRLDTIWKKRISCCYAWSSCALTHTIATAT